MDRKSMDRNSIDRTSIDRLLLGQPLLDPSTLEKISLERTSIDSKRVDKTWTIPAKQTCMGRTQSTSNLLETVLDSQLVGQGSLQKTNKGALPPGKYSVEEGDGNGASLSKFAHEQTVHGGGDVMRALETMKEYAASSPNVDLPLTLANSMACHEWST
ncbi:hypothetical protein CYMTET_9963 [Cymbomonas tetramitiformis]|uniref:Uncharacterized protein n=1 Tax=Cymbomonas tetramitiformis TaxID=36881 RepID=A0AAE0GQQ2_9CHLO|nr:hypothetical protein CYMTET_9963 [Cymbomonas tetramitiformis]